MDRVEFRSQTLTELLPELFTEPNEMISPSEFPVPRPSKEQPVVSSRLSPQPSTKPDPEEPVEDPNFSFDGFQVVRGEFFSHMNEPSISLYDGKITFNSACLKKAPDHDFVLVMVNPMSKTMVVMPAQEETKDSIRWRNVNGKPRPVGCGIVIGMIIHLMNWDPEYRYKMIGKAIKRNDQLLFVFDLHSAEIYTRSHIVENGQNRIKTSRRPSYSEGWKDRFGVSFEEHKKALQVSVFDKYVVFNVNPPPAKDNIRKEVRTDE